MGEAVGHPVLRIRRIAYGPVHLGKMRAGEFRLLGPEEIRRIRQDAGLDKEQSKE
jgi:16S rRNA U516 pseudouridylate synthase RsuA-like enzyme